MQITNISLQAKNPDRASVFVDGKYSFSLSIMEITEFGVCIGQDITSSDITDFKSKSELGKHYINSYKYCLLRPRSVYEVSLYLKNKHISKEFIDCILNKLIKNKILDDNKFCIWWVENRNRKKGSSILQLKSELKKKGIQDDLINQVLKNSDRNEKDDLHKIYIRKKNKYQGDKMKSYLLSKGFKYSDINEFMSQYSDDSEAEDEVANGFIKA